MNKKYILCVFFVLIIITNSSYAFPTYSKPMSKRVDKVPMMKTGRTSPREGTSNATNSAVDSISNVGAIGYLNAVKPDGSVDDCTATVINTNNGNIAITAAHCLWDHNSKNWNTDMFFFPGYNNGEPGPVGKVIGYRWFIWSSHEQNILLDDYGFIKFYYQEGKRLQDDTGAFDYDLDIPGDNYPVNVFGYPGDGDMDCPHDGQHQCEWEGLSFEMPKHDPDKDYRAITIDVGAGASGGPWIREYDPAANTGKIMGVSYGILPEPYPDETAAWKWTHDDFSRLLNFAENN